MVPVYSFFVLLVSVGLDPLVMAFASGSRYACGELFVDVMVSLDLPGRDLMWCCCPRVCTHVPTGASFGSTD